MIHILDNNLINKIAAGEVVERPASVVKELVENSLDAGADFIIVEIKNGGMDLIEVSDNGAGMNKEDALLCVERHATSKISSMEDLHNILTFGFRGEALAAISSVSNFSVQTKEMGASVGALVETENNNFKISETGCPEGTKVRVENLFFNVPARRKFLKGSATEFSHILNILVNIAMVQDNVRFKLIHNGKNIFDYQNSPFVPSFEEGQGGVKIVKYAKTTFLHPPYPPQRGELLALFQCWEMRVRDILGKDNFDHMIPFHQEAGEMLIEGFISRPEITKINKSQQYLFVNNRPVYNNIVHKAIYNGYRNLIPTNNHPMFVIKLNLEPEMVDVNVHPRKMEVKFLYQQEVFKCMENIIREVLNNREILNFKSIQQPQGKFQISKFSSPSQSSFSNNKFAGDNFKKEKRVSFESISRFNEAMFLKEEKAEENWKIIGQVKDLYLVVESAEGIFIIDQHAAHERILFDKLKNDIEQGNIKSQQVLLALTIDLNIKEIGAFKQGVALFKEIGFEIEEFGQNSIIVRGVPQDISGKDYADIIKGIIDDFLVNLKDDLSQESVLSVVRDKVLSYIACRGAVKAGDSLAGEEQINLARKVVNKQVKPTCPHGRPIFIEFNWVELEKRFKRR